MKKISPILFVMILILVSCGITPDEAAHYNLRIVGIQIDVKYKVDDLEKAFNTFDSDVVDIALGKAIEQTEMSLRNLNRIYCIEEDSVFHTATENFFNTYLETLNNEYTQMYKLYLIPDDEYGNEKQKQFEKLKDKKNKNLRTAFEKFAKTQKQFALKYNVKLVDIDKLEF